MPPTASPALPSAAALLGTVCGARTFAAPAMAAARGRYGHGPVRRVLLLAAGGEMVGDKLAMAPARTSPPALLGRMLSGAMMATGGRSVTPSGSGLAAGVGAATAALSAFATQRLRARLVRSTGLPDAVLGAGEDLLVFLVAARVTSGGAASPGRRRPGDGG